MTTYPVPIVKRAAFTIKTLTRKVKRLEARVDALASAQPNVGVVATVATSSVTVYINGNAAPSASLPFLSSYTPATNDSVLLVYAAGQLIVAGKVTS